MDVSGVLHMRPPSPHKIRAAVTQADVTAVSVPVLEGAEVDASFKVCFSLFVKWMQASRWPYFFLFVKWMQASRHASPSL